MREEERERDAYGLISVIPSCVFANKERKKKETRRDKKEGEG